MADIIRIDNLDDERLKVFSTLSERELLNRDKPENGLFIAESPKVIERALSAGYEPVCILIEDSQIENEGAEIIANCPDIPVFTSDFDTLTGITGYKLTRGMLCCMKRKALPSPGDLLSKATRAAVLEDVENPTNVGAVFRSAAALGMDCVLLTGGCSDPFYRRSIRVSMGSVFKIPWTFLPENHVSLIKDFGFTVAALALRDDNTLLGDDKLSSSDKLAVYLGNEGNGLSEETVKKCDYVVKIPMQNGVDSLNVSVASALAFWELGHNKGC